MPPISITTPRLVLRQWQEQDLPHWQALNADPQVMRYFPAPLSAEESQQAMHRMQQLIAHNGWGFWALEHRQDKRCIGTIGLHHNSDTVPGRELVEIGWRLDRHYWRQGFTEEGARASLSFAFEQLGLAEVYAFTALTNLPSQGVMKKLGMRNTGEDFDHPKLDDCPRLQRHCLYRIDAATFATS